MRQLFSDVQLFLVVCCNVALLSNALGQADRPEVGREVSRIQRPTLFPMVTGEGEAALGGKLLQRREEYGRLRILYDTRPVAWLSTQIFSGAFYTTNAALLPNNAQDNWYFQQGFNVNLSKGFFKNSLYPHASFYQAWFGSQKPGVQGIERIPLRWTPTLA